MKKLCRFSGKAKFRSKEHALQRIERILERRPRARVGRKWSAYKCPSCDHWHLTSGKKRLAETAQKA